MAHHSKPPYLKWFKMFIFVSDVVQELPTAFSLSHNP